MSKVCTKITVHFELGTSTKSSYMEVCHICEDLTRFRFNKIAIQGTPRMAVDKEARAYRESTHIVILSVPCPYTPLI